MLSVFSLLQHVRKHPKPLSFNPETERRKNMTRVFLLVVFAVSICLFAFSLVGWVMGAIPVDTLIIVMIIVLSALLAMMISRSRFWRIGSTLPAMIIFLSAAYGNYIGGYDAPAMILYPLVIVFVAFLLGLRAMYIAFGLSITTFVLLSMAHHLGYITAIRTSESAFTNRMAITITAIAGITFLTRLLIIHFRKALEDSDRHFQEVQTLAYNNSKLYNTARQEIAERELAEQQLRTSELKYRELVQNASSIIMRLNTRGEITFFNEFAEKLFGYPVDEVIGQSVMGIIVPKTDSNGKDLSEMIEGILKNPLMYESNENENITRDGRKLWIAWANRPIYDADGMLREILCVGNDITDRKRAREEKERIQAQLLQAQKMEAVGTLSSGLAHDFNNLLGGIMGSLSLMRIVLNETDYPGRNTLTEYINTAMESSERATEMIKRLMAISRRQDVALVPVDINRALENVGGVCSNSFPKSVTIDISYAPSPAHVLADPSMIEQALLNLMVNASHAMTLMREENEKQGGTLKAGIDLIDYNERSVERENMVIPNGRYVKIIVSDTGVGIARDTLDRIFEPFFTTRKKGEGSGLGLAMVYNIVTQFDGYITVKSEPGHGTTFTLYLPAAGRALGTEPAGEQSIKITRGTGTILVVDDELLMLKVAAMTLKLCGYTVITADNGITALEIFRSDYKDISAVLVDMSMPGMSGIEVIEEMLKITDTVPAILSSGYSRDEKARQMIIGGSAYFIEKPYTAEQLSAYIKEVINCSRKATRSTEQ